MQSQSTIFPGLELKCVCFDDKGKCLCGNEEIVIRNYSCGQLTMSMTPEQRAWCISEATWYSEGGYNEQELTEMNDQELAHAVICSWIDYVDTHF